MAEMAGRLQLAPFLALLHITQVAAARQGILAAQMG
jgi:hypothetical protein